MAHGIEINFPVDESVTKAVLSCSPPKQILVVRVSGRGICFGAPPLGLSIVIPPLISVATQIFPALSNASESYK